MAMFLAHIAIILEVFAVATGLLTLHYSLKMRSAFVVSAGVMLISFGILGGFCTSYYGIKYFFHGHYEHAYDEGIPRDSEGGKHSDGSPPGD